MTSATGYVLLYGLVAAASPLALTATLLVVRSERPRTNGIAFLAGFLLGTTVACILGLILGQAAIERLESRSIVEGLAALLVGVALLIAGLRERLLPPRPEAETSRGGAILAGLSHVGPGAALSMAGLLGFGGPKRLILTLLAMASVSEVGLGDLQDLTLIVLYIAIATSLVSVPVVAVVFAGDRGTAIIARCESWLKARQSVLRFWVATGLGAALVIDGLVRLIG